MPTRIYIIARQTIPGVYVFTDGRMNCMLLMLSTLQSWAKVLVSMLPLIPAIIYVLKSISTDSLDLVFMKKEQQRLITVVQFVFIFAISLGAFAYYAFFVEIPYNEILFAILSYLYLIVWLVNIILYFVMNVKCLRKQVERKMSSRSIRKFCTGFISVSLLILFGASFYLLGVLHKLWADTETQKELPIIALELAILITCYLIIVLKYFNNISKNRIWISTSDYTKLYLLHAFDSKTILCEIPSSDTEEKKNYILIPKDDIHKIEIHMEFVDDEV